MEVVNPKTVKLPRTLMRTRTQKSLITRTQSRSNVQTRKAPEKTITAADIRDTLLAMPHYGIGLFVDLDDKIDLSAASAPKQIEEKADDNSRRGKRAQLKRQATFIKGVPATPIEREWWTRLRRDSQLPDGETMNLFSPKDYMDMDADTLDAVRKTRNKISASLNLDGDRVSRLIRLRQNVFAIEKKFRSLLKNTNRKEKAIDEGKQGAFSADVFCRSRFVAPGEALFLFRKMSRLLLIAIKWLNYVFTKDHLNWEQELKTFADVADEMEQTTRRPQCLKDSGLNFDKNYYKANREISLSADVRHYLSLTPDARTPDMLQQVLHGLQTLQSLCEYPLKTQEGLCRVAWYQRVEAKKVILRQGHHPECFYFILSGAAYVKKMTRDKESGDQLISTVARLTRGQSFGEVSLIFDTLRTATVESATTMELLAIGKEDFQTIFMNAEDPTDEADHIKFLRQIPVFKHWPIEVLKKEPGTCLLHYFKRGTLVTENGLESEWLYFIKSGSCEAIKRLKAVKGRSSKEIHSQINPLYDVILPRLNPAEQASPRIDSRTSSRSRHRQHINKEVLESMTSYYDGFRRTLSAPCTRATTNIETPSSPRIRKPQSHRKTRFDPSLVTNPRCTTPKDTTPVTPTPVTSRTQIFITEEELRESIPPVPSSKPSGTPGVSKPRFTNLYLKRSTANPRYSEMLSTTPSMLNVTNNRDAARTTNNKRRCQQKQQQQQQQQQEQHDQQVFVKVDVLQSRDIFGMQTLEAPGETNKEEVPSIALVSRGAEVVLLAKKTFLKYSNDNVNRAVQEMTTRYPREATLQDNLQIKADWDVYRHSVLKDVLDVCKGARSLTPVT